MTRSRFRRWALLAAASLSASAAWADVLVVSQNTLRLGEYKTRGPAHVAGRNDYVRSIARWPGNALAQMTFLQEVMPAALESDIQPPGATVRFGRAKGTDPRHVERYGMVVPNGTASRLTVLCHVDTAPLVTRGFTMERPPDATLIQDASGARPQLLWLVNFHALFGSGATARRPELGEMGRIVARLRAAQPPGCPRTTDNVVVVGDWNFPGRDAGFRDFSETPASRDWVCRRMCRPA